MEFNLIVVLAAAAFILILLFLIWSIKSTSSKVDALGQAQKDDKSLSLMQQQIGYLTQNINQQLQNLSNQFQKTTGDIGNTLGTVKQDLTKMESATKEVLEKAKDISNLEQLLRAPKFRGGLGEFFLGDLLSQILPPAHFTLQYRFKSGEKVDAAVHIGKNIVPIDAKFPLENFKKHLEAGNERERNELRKKFNSDVKKHIDDIAGKYILPDEGTYDFALMYIPAENIYYETILKEETFGENKSLFSYAIDKRIIPVSPNSFFAYLQVIVLGLKGLQIEKSAHKIYQSLSRLQGDLIRFRNDFQILGTHLTNAKGRYDDAEKRLDKFTDKLELIGGEEPDSLPETKE
ncbi:MAG: DNA recombination protein RmuC [Candidatus Aminicenantes bacterium]|nr:DNA recombination protein RmuC [Candidatus Aminicenantes bacterium]